MSDILIQGNLDKSCGFYSAINAISEVNGMRYQRSKDLFFEFASKHRALTSRGVLGGLRFKDMRDDVIPKLMALLDPDEAVQVRFPFLDRRFETARDFADALRDRLGDGCAVVCFGHPWNHWTAVRQVTDRALLLKDSTYQRKKLISAIDLASNDGLYRSGTLVHARQTAIFSR